MIAVRKWRPGLASKLMEEMYPETYKGLHGHEYRLEERVAKKEAA